MTTSENKRDYIEISLYAKQTAKVIRKLLPLMFPGIKFSVRKDNNSVDVNWIDGPTVGTVDSRIKWLQSSRGIDMSDYHMTGPTLREYVTPELLDFIKKHVGLDPFRQTNGAFKGVDPAIVFEAVIKALVEDPTGENEEYPVIGMWTFNHYVFCEREVTETAILRAMTYIEENYDWVNLESVGIDLHQSHHYKSTNPPVIAWVKTLDGYPVYDAPRWNNVPGTFGGHLVGGLTAVEIVDKISRQFDYTQDIRLYDRNGVPQTNVDYPGIVDVLQKPVAVEKTKAPAIANKADDENYPAVEEFKGNPVLRLSEYFVFGSKKAELIIQFADEIVQFADQETFSEDPETEFPELADFKGKPVIRLSRRFSFGRGKAAQIVANMTAIVEFVGGMSVMELDND